MTARRKLVLRAGVLALLVVSMSGCATQDLRFGWPEGITDQAEKMRELWTWSVVAALIIGVIVWGLIFWTVAFHRAKDNEIPRQFKENLPLEIIYTIIPLVLVLGLFYFTVVVQNFVLDDRAEPEVTVQVNAFKWNWEFEYADTSVENSDEPVSTVGSSTEIPILVLPVDQVVRLELESTDVIHSFWVPEFLFKLDILPGENDGQDNVFQITVREEGAYVGRCAELCGSYHAYMNFEVRAVSADDFADYISARESGMTTAEALESIGQDPLSSTTRPMDSSREQASSID